MMSRLQQTLIAIVAVVVIGMLWFVGNDKGEIVPVDTAAAPSEAEQPASVPRGIPRNGTLDPISIDPNRSADLLPQYPADALLDDYRDNAGAADDRYRGKYFIVEGVASGIRRDAAKVFLEIRTNDPGQVVRADLLQQQICGPAGRTCEVEARATMVRRGQKVAVECTGAGLGEGGTPLLADCLLRGGAN
ncbi:OB-fold putative lipoprotein [Cupriavidus sp. RAF12]|uniref:OB-fold putative lipoprotein n=1 Tax=Cupriavidus sp. RAF12 TaxID=3233050 RepID=UPI003F905464